MPNCVQPGGVGLLDPDGGQPAMNESMTYERFLRRHFASIYRWSLERTGEESEGAALAQRVLLDLWRSLPLEARRSGHRQAGALRP